MVTITDRVRFSETDLMAVVHHTNYLRWFEAGRVAYFREAGIDLNALQKAGYMIPIVDVQAHFRQSARFDDIYEVQTTLVKVSRITIEFSYQIFRKSDGALLVEGTSRNAFVNLEGKPERLTGEYFDNCSNWLLKKGRSKHDQCDFTDSGVVRAGAAGDDRLCRPEAH